jgi:hypothetical protein
MSRRIERGCYGQDSPLDMDTLLEEGETLSP